MQPVYRKGKRTVGGEDPGNLAQGIINASKNIVQTSSTAQNMIKNFQETVKIYQQGVRHV